MQTLIDLGKAAKAASVELAQASTTQKNNALNFMANALIAESEQILSANALDMARARENRMAPAFLDRLLLTEGRLHEMAQGLRLLSTLPDPVGKVEKGWYGQEDIQITKVRVPLGVLGIIYEARPNVTADAAGIAIKTGNAVILRGGSDAINSNSVVVEVLSQAVAAAGLPDSAIQIVMDTSRETATALMQLKDYIDLLIPRGGAGLISSVVENATIPVIETGVGNCHIYIDNSADMAMAKAIVINAKTQRPAVCNSAEGLLIHRDVAVEALKVVGKALVDAGVEVRGCKQTKKLMNQLGMPCRDALKRDYYAEYDALIISCKIVQDVKEAVDHINIYGSKHSEAIITQSLYNANLFQQQVDAAAVYVNASTRFTDGFVFGFGAEIGISTQKLHARGPMGLEEMTSYKYLIKGNGQIRK